MWYVVQVCVVYGDADQIRIKQRFSRMLREYDQARRIGSYLHQYKQYPMFSKDFSEFDDARLVTALAA